VAALVLSPNREHWEELVCSERWPSTRVLLACEIQIFRPRFLLVGKGVER
jgi:hypothetical protein